MNNIFIYNFSIYNFSISRMTPLLKDLLIKNYQLHFSFSRYLKMVLFYFFLESRRILNKVFVGMSKNGHLCALGVVEPDPGAFLNAHC